VVGLLFPIAYGGRFHPGVVLTVCLAAWVVFSSVADLRNKLRNARPWWSGLGKLTPAYYGMLLAHIGLALSVAGVGLTSVYTEERDLRVAPGQQVQVAGYDFRFAGTEAARGPNYMAERGIVLVGRNGRALAELHPEKRRYNARRDQVMTEAAIDAGFSRDIYVALGEPLGEGAWALRIHYKPFVRWIWLGGLLMAAGGAVAAADKRYRLARRAAPMPVARASQAS